MGADHGEETSWDDKLSKEQALKKMQPRSIVYIVNQVTTKRNCTVPASGLGKVCTRV